MKAAIVFTGTGPILILTTYKTFDDPKLVEKLMLKGINKFIAGELPLDLVKMKYQSQFDAILNDVKQANDLRVLDYNGHNVFHNFSFADIIEYVRYEPARDMAGAVS